MKRFNNFFVAESIIDPVQPAFNSKVFDVEAETPKLKPEVRSEILAGIHRLGHQFPIIDYTLIGSILTKQYTETSDLDINILIQAKSSDMEDARALANKLSGKNLLGTKHPIQYHVLNDPTDFKMANHVAQAVFDLSKNKFIKTAVERPFHIEKYLTKFKSAVKEIENLKGDLKDELIDYSELKKLSSTDAKLLFNAIEKELSNIEDTAKGLVDLYKKIVKDRAEAFKKQLTANDIREYGSNHHLPGNVVYKLLERHYYIQFLEKVKEVMADGKITPGEADQLNNLVNK